MPALLALIPKKDLIYAGIILVVLAVGSGAWIHHDHVQQAKGAAAVTAADAKLAVMAKAKDDAIAANAQHELDLIGVTYHAKINLPPVANTGIVCRNAARGSAVPASAHSEPGAPSADVLPSAGAFDPSGPTLSILRDADERVSALQADVQTLVDEMNRLHAATAPR
jgi:hypothetical protein